MAEATKPLIATVILNWNRRADTLACLASLERQQLGGLRQRIVLVDNGSEDGTAAAVQVSQPTVEVVALATNRGFAAGVNVGVRRAFEIGADWVLLLNNDTIAEPALLTHLISAATAGGPRVGLLAPTVYYFDRPDRVWPSAGRRRRLTLAAVDTTAAATGRPPYEVDWATGCCLMVRRDVWSSVGQLDERYQFFYEDHEFCLRARAAGWQILHVPGARVWHRVSASTGRGSALAQYLLARASVPYYWRQSSGLWRALIVAYRCGSFARTVGRHLARGRPSHASAYMRGLVDGIRDQRRGTREDLKWVINTFGAKT